MGTSIKLPVKYNPGLYAQTINGPTISNTLVESSIVGSGIGNLTVPGNIFKVGDSYHAKIGGVISTQNNHEITVKAKSDGTVLATTLQSWELEIDFTIAAIGTTGSIKTNGNFIFNRNTGNYIGIAFNDTEVLDTTIDQTLDITVQWNQEDISDAIFSHQFVLYKTFIS